MHHIRLFNNFFKIIDPYNPLCSYDYYLYLKEKQTEFDEIM